MPRKAGVQSHGGCGLMGRPSAVTRTTVAWNPPVFQCTPRSPVTPILLSDLGLWVGLSVTIEMRWTQVTRVPGRKGCCSRGSDIFRDLRSGVDASELPTEMEPPPPP